MGACQVLKIEVKVQISCQKCKACIMKAVTKLTGVDKIEIDAEKDMVFVTGEVDPVDVVCQVRKTGKVALIVKVGPPPKPDGGKPVEPVKPLPVCCATCERITIKYQEYGGLFCSIM